MSEEKNFIARWSDRKLQRSRQESLQESRQKSSQEPNERVNAAAGRDDELQRAGQQAAPEDRSDAPPARPDGKSKASVATPPAFDPATLPPLESITAESDIRAFLAPGVPAELTRAALRRAWSADPRIRDFVGLAENAWDFTAPDAIGGFGPLAMTDEVKRALTNLVGRSMADAGTDQPPPPATTDDEPQIAAAAGADAVPGPAGAASESISGDCPVDQPMVRDTEDTAAQHAETSADHESVTKRPHGRALPK
jgi:hypothetical protein